jgi:S-adenosylmethionine/arginine decarboxylase-like enzyme
MTHILLDIEFSELQDILVNINKAEDIIYKWVQWNEHRIMDKTHFQVFPSPIIDGHTLPFQGYTGFVILAESHISFHTYPEYKFISIDFFSCKKLDEKKNMDFIEEHIFCKNPLKKKNIQFIDREYNDI